MRYIITLLLLLLVVLGVWTFIGYEPWLLGPGPDNYHWWWPPEISTFGEKIDFLFRLISVMILVAFVLTGGLLVWFVYKYSAPREDKGVFSHGNHKLEMIWTAVPAALLVLIAFAQMGTWADIKFAGATKDKPVHAEIYASQFDWRFRYPGPDKEFGTVDDFETAWELVVPADEDLVFHLRSQDVLHSFFVPHLRVKQDAVPGMTIPIWFNVDSEQFIAAFEGHEDKTFDIICAELCGWGHYKMSGRVRVLPHSTSNEDYVGSYEEWVDQQVERHFSNDAPLD
ncbi:MAG: cytochrome c oxidase subunit II [Planctomycetota bacterium]|nr:cytochrome c oxidase subunit II [Planctomycetota bacterium]